MTLCREQITFFKHIEKNQIRLGGNLDKRGVFLTRVNKAEIRGHIKVLMRDAKVIDSSVSGGIWKRTFFIPAADHWIKILHFKGGFREYISVTNKGIEG